MSITFTGSSGDREITLWTAQGRIVTYTICNHGVYHVKKEYILRKYEESAYIFLEAYNWFVKAAEKIVPRPDGSEYPIWLFADIKYVDCQKGCNILEITVDCDKVVLFDRKKWNRVLNLSYIPRDEKDEEEYFRMLKSQGIDDETVIYMTDYYPALKAKVKKSWERLFDINGLTSDSLQASLWEIKKEWVISPLL